MMDFGGVLLTSEEALLRTTGFTCPVPLHMVAFPQAAPSLARIGCDKMEGGRRSFHKGARADVLPPAGAAATPVTSLKGWCKLSFMHALLQLATSLYSYMSWDPLPHSTHCTRPMANLRADLCMCVTKQSGMQL